MAEKSAITSVVCSSTSSPGVAEDSTDEAVKRRILALSDRITALAGGERDRIADSDSAYDIARAIKPYVDRLCALKRLLAPIGSIAEKSEKIAELQARIAEDVATVEKLSDHVGDAVDPALLNELDGELAAVKRDRKLCVQEIDEDELQEDELGEDAPVLPAQGAVSPSLPLSQRPLQERLKLILGKRFVSMADLAHLLNVRLDEQSVRPYEEALQQVWDTVFAREELSPYVARNRLKSLQKAMGDYGLVPRVSWLDAETPTSLAALRARYGSFFVQARGRGLWYARTELYQATFSTPHWALVDKQYLNCTFKKPSIRLLMYARANGLSPSIVRQKSVLEDVYDRIVLGLAVGGQFFANCHSITSTIYKQAESEVVKQAYVYERDGSIRISGKQGTPHWRPNRPRWPGVLPAIIFTV